MGRETFRPSCVLVTGGAGFIGSNFIRWLLKRNPTLSVVNLDLRAYAGNLESLERAPSTSSMPEGSALAANAGRPQFSLATNVLTEGQE